MAAPPKEGDKIYSHAQTSLQASQMKQQ